jgi:hypothetical protein
MLGPEGMGRAFVKIGFGNGVAGHVLPEPSPRSREAFVVCPAVLPW